MLNAFLQCSFHSSYFYKFSTPLSFSNTHTNHYKIYKLLKNPMTSSSFQLMAHTTMTTTTSTTRTNSVTSLHKLSNYKPFESELIPGLPNDVALECLLRVPITSHPTLRLVSHVWKVTVSHPSFYSLRRRAAIAEHLVFLVQPMSPHQPTAQENKVLGYDDVGEKEAATEHSQLLYKLGVYNSSYQEWFNLANITIPTFGQCVALPDVRKVIVLGGWDPETLEPVSRVLILDLASGTWREGSPMPTARSFFACAVGPATVYVAGGHDGQKNALRTAEAYDVEADQWRALPPMVEERDESQGLFLTNDSKFWVISGYGTESQGRFRSDAEIYDPESNTWTHIDGVWPYLSHTPKSTAVVTIECQQRWMYIASGEAKKFNFEEKAWKTMNLGPISKSVSGSSSISLVDVSNDGSGRILVTGNGEKCGEGCTEEGCGGEGVFMLEKGYQVKNKGEINWRWKHIHTPCRFLGLPFSASHLFI